MNTLLLAAALWVGAVGGVAAVVVAIAAPKWRRAGFLVAAVLFIPIGVLGILSVGIFFLAAALACVIAAVVNPGGKARTSASLTS